MSRPNMSRYKYTPQMLEGKDADYMRRQYRYLRTVLNKRADRIAAKGFGQYEYGQRLPAASTISDADIKAALLDASRRARSEETMSRGFEQRLERRVKGLQKAGYKCIDENNVDDFWRFMQRTRDRSQKSTYDSHVAANVYNIARSRGVSTKTLERNFAKFMRSEEQMTRLYNAMKSFTLEPGRKRMSSTEIRSRL